MNNDHSDAGTPIEDQYPKLVRDRIPEIVAASSKQASLRVLEDDQEYLEFLLRKLIEEATELFNAKSDSHQKEELADVFEVIEAVLVLKGLTRSDIETIQNQKRDKRGGFTKRLLMIKKP